MVFMEGDGGVAVSDETTVVAAVPLFKARYDKYEGPGAADLVEGEVSTGGGGSLSEPIDVHRSIRSCVVSTGSDWSIARPYFARLLSAWMTTDGRIKDAFRPSEINIQLQALASADRPMHR